MDKNNIDKNDAPVDCPATQLLFEDDRGYIEITKNGVIGVGSGKWAESKEE
ncbi:hypothetical protein [Oligoflexus tunisiensis]|uniref:hypothetical protein n=1 Tax=Oligoflexus tunisiensis TaxID=708132 RepID=UPI00159F029A|nr:hypothetical protein [Oligoflexus tunisiensis]